MAVLVGSLKGDALDLAGEQNTQGDQERDPQPDPLTVGGLEHGAERGSVNLRAPDLGDLQSLQNDDQ